jgi:serine/threonine-protein kinase
MELLLGLSIDAICRRLAERGEEMPVEVAVSVAVQTAQALAHVHELRGDDGQPLRIVHRDISPHNLFVTEHGVVKVLDFGIAKAIAALDVHTRTGALKGKLAYMAPEQLLAAELDGRTDLWGLGVTLWEMLAGVSLFSKDGLLDTIQAIKEAPLLAPSAIRAGIPEELDRLVLRLIERPRDQRPGTASEVAHGLARISRELDPVDNARLASMVDRLGRRELTRSRSLIRGEPIAPELTPSDPIERRGTTQTGERNTDRRPAASVGTGQLNGEGGTAPSLSIGRPSPGPPRRRWPTDLIAVSVGSGVALLVHHLWLSQ